MCKGSGIMLASRAPADRIHNTGTAIARLPTMAILTLVALAILTGAYAIEAGSGRLVTERSGMGGWSVHAKNADTPQWIIELMDAQAPNHDSTRPRSQGWWI